MAEKSHDLFNLTVELFGLCDCVSVKSQSMNLGFFVQLAQLLKSIHKPQLDGALKSAL